MMQPPQLVAGSGHLGLYLIPPGVPWDSLEVSKKQLCGGFVLSASFMKTVSDHIKTEEIQTQTAQTVWSFFKIGHPIVPTV